MCAVPSRVLDQCGKCDFSRAAEVGSRASEWEFSRIGQGFGSVGTRGVAPFPGRWAPLGRPPPFGRWAPFGSPPSCVGGAPSRGSCAAVGGAPSWANLFPRGRSRLPPQNKEKQHHRFIMRRRLPPRGGGVAFWSGGWVRLIVPVVCWSQTERVAFGRNGLLCAGQRAR